MIYKMVGLFDSHGPHETINTKPLIAYLKDTKPTHFVFGGDNYSMDTISRHKTTENVRNYGLENIMADFKKETELMNMFIDRVQEALPKNCLTIYIEGNHEYWLQVFQEKFPQFDKKNLDTLLNLKKRSIKLIPFGGRGKVGKMYIRHGHEYGGSNPAKQAVERSGHNVMFGHHHKDIRFPKFSDVEATDKHAAIAVPCYCKLSPHYGRGNPNAWTNGFGWMNFKKSGKFCAGVQNVSPDGNFITQSGKEYK